MTDLYSLGDRVAVRASERTPWRRGEVVHRSWYWLAVKLEIDGSIVKLRRSELAARVRRLALVRGGGES